MNRDGRDAARDPQKPREDEALTTEAIPAGADLDTWSRHGWNEGLQIEAVPELETLSVRTRNSTYQIIVLCPRTGEILVRGGRFFPEYTSARLVGSSLGGSFLKVRGIYVGFRMELHDGEQMIVTSEIRSIRFMSNDRIQ